MKVTLVRFNVSRQKSSACDKAIEFSWVQLFTNNWTSGSRSRVKTFTDFSVARAWLYKLRSGLWLSDVDYNSALRLIAACDTGNDPRSDRAPVHPTIVEWEIFPYNFR